MKLVSYAWCELTVRIYDNINHMYQINLSVHVIFCCHAECQKRKKFQYP